MMKVMIKLMMKVIIFLLFVRIMMRGFGKIFTFVYYKNIIYKTFKKVTIEDLITFEMAKFKYSVNFDNKHKSNLFI